MTIQEGDIVKYENGDTIVQGKVVEIRHETATVRLNWPVPAFRGRYLNFEYLPIKELECV